MEPRWSMEFGAGYAADDVVGSIIKVLAFVVTLYVIILAIFIFCYWRILVVIRRQARVMASHSAAGPSNASQEQSHRIQSNVIKTMILVSALYAVTWLPFNIYYALGALDIIPNLSFNSSLFYAMICLANMYTTTNPFIYATKFNPVKKILLEMIPCKKTPIQPIELH